MEKIIVINNGSVSKKYALYEAGQELISFHFDETATDILLKTVTKKDTEEKTFKVWFYRK